ncbi:MAG TPA: EamA family transporter [Gemmatimonadaceae bacterium]
MSAPRGAVLAAFAAVYVIWGSTYLGMRFAVETLPPFAVSGVRYFCAGVLLWIVARMVGKRDEAPVPWRGHAVVGTLLTLGNASVAVAVRTIPSGVASLLVAMTPCFMVLLEWWRRPAHPPRGGVVAGLVLGLAGIAVLVGPGWLGAGRIDPVGAGVVLAGSVAWSTGSIYSRTLPRHASPWRTSAIQMLCGGAAVTVIAALLGEFADFDPGAASLRSVLALVYLVLVGSVIGYSAYMYLLGVTSAARASTYAFVNPVVAVLLGALFAGEALTSRIVLAGGIIVAAVALITLHGGDRRAAVARVEAGGVS